MAFREEKASELLRMVDIIRRNIGGVDTSSVTQAASKLKNSSYIPTQRNGTRDPETWGYEIENFRLPVSTERHMRPEGVNKLELRLDMAMIADCKQWMSFGDPLLELNFNVAVRGIKQGNETSTHHLGFHLDRHIETEHDSEEPHPIYHIQYCVNPDDDSTFNYGSVLHLDTPRVMHYPMEFILGLGFLTSNFFPMVFDELISDGNYTNLYKKYQEGFWKPYSQTLAAQWPFDNTRITWEPVTSICPLMI